MHKNNILPIECTKLTEHVSDLAQNGAELSGNDGHNSIFGAFEFVPASDLVELGFPMSSSSVVEPAGVLVSSSASSELIEPGFSASSSSSHLVGFHGHPFGVEPAGSSSSVAALHLTT